MLTACTAFPSAGQKGGALAAASSHLSSSEETPTPARQILTPPTRLQPQAEGTPLPPQDHTIANAWPPDLKLLIDNLITLFLKSTADTAPNIEHVQRRLGITLTEEKLSTSEKRVWGKRYTVNETRYGDPTESIVFRSFYAISTSEVGSNERSQTLRLQVSPKLSGFCLNPYELAVYTGWKFQNFDTSPHANVRQWPPAYVWGMFAWSNTGRHGGPGYSILVNLIQDAAGKTIGADCVYSITVVGRYPKEEKS